MQNLRVKMETALKILGGIALFIGIFAIIAVRVGAKAEQKMKDIFNKK